MQNKNKVPIFHRSLMRNKVSHFIDILEDVEVSFYRKLLRKFHAKRLDPIKKKKIKIPDIIFPGPKVPVEWWYFTGHLFSGKRKFGFEFCFFKFHPQAIRFGFIPLSFLHPKPYLALHSAITDKNKNKFFFNQDTGLTHKDKIDYSSLNLKLNQATLKLNKKFFIKNKQMSLEILPKKPMIKHFGDGFRVMYTHPESRTYYVTIPRLKVKGRIKSDSKSYSVKGEAWFDHQKCNVTQKTSLIGWDWFGLMFDNNTELMFFVLRNKKGIIKKQRVGSFITKNSKIVPLGPKNVNLSYIDVWKSPLTGIIYPSGWEMKIPKLRLDIKISPCIKNQEIDSFITAGISYWEGACDIKGILNGKRIKGKGYVELVGYDKRVISEFIRKSTI